MPLSKREHTLAKKAREQARRTAEEVEARERAAEEARRLRRAAEEAEELEIGTFILWNPESSKPPRVVMETLGEARRTARGMAERHEPAKFFIMKAVEVAQVPRNAAKLTKV